MNKKSVLLMISLWLLTSCYSNIEPEINRSSSIDIIESPTEIISTNSSISWDEAYYYVGEVKTVCGPVVDSTYASTSNGKPTFLNLGRKYPDPDRFTVVIWGDYRDNFPSNLESHYFGKTICAKGTIEEYNGILEIEVDISSEITIP